MSALSVALNTNSSSSTSSNANGLSSSQQQSIAPTGAASPHITTTASNTTNTTGPSPPSSTASIAIAKSEFQKQPSTPTPPQSLSNHHTNSLHHARHSSLSSSPYGTPPLSTSSSYRSALAYDDYPMQHGPQPYPNARPIRSSSKPRRFSSSSTTTTTTGKSPTITVGSSSPSSSSSGVNGPLNTNSPVALAAAAAVTPDKLARLLLSQGPLAIRHITSHLAMSIPGFGDLSLSKQRRLIIAVLDAEDPANGVTFEKVGWGRWAAFKRGEAPQPIVSTTARDSVAHQYAPHTKSKRRESITVDQIRPPRSPLLSAADHHTTRHQNGVWAADDVDLADDDMMFHNSSQRIQSASSDVAVFDDDDEDYEDYDTDDDGLRRPRANSMARRHHRGSSSLIGSAVQNAAAMRQQHQSETDEEDWQTMGPASLRRDSNLSVSSSSKPPLLEPHSPASYGFSNAPYSHTRGISIGSDKREQEAIDALVQLASI